MTMERTYTVPLRKGFRKAPRYRKTNRAVATLIAFIERHMKSDDVRIGQHLNHFLWANGARNPPPRVTVTAQKDDDGVVRVELEGKEYKESARAKPKEEATTLKDKLTQTLTGGKTDENAKTAEQPAEKTAEKAKPAGKPASAKKKTPADKKPADKPDGKTADKKTADKKGAEKKAAGGSGTTAGAAERSKAGTDTRAKKPSTQKTA